MLRRFPRAAISWIPNLRCLAICGVLPLALPASATTPYAIGQPTDEEQYHLELINRARANPTAEGQRLKNTGDPAILVAYNQYGVDLNMMASEFAALPVRPPLAMNAKLLQAARGHSLDMFTHAFQSHTGSDGSTPATRAAAAGYSSSVGENVYAHGASTWHAHAGFQVDWGLGGTGGMQAGRGHRMNIHGTSREIGIGLHLGTKTSGGTTYGPQLVTQNFGAGAANTAYVTGVVYHDRNGNAFYDPGEGLGGVTVSVAGSEYHAVTANSGGYTVPVSTAAVTRAVTFSGPGIASGASAVVAGGNNVKVDLVVPYSAAVPSGPSEAWVGHPSHYSFEPVAGAVGHDWKWATRAAVPADGAEDLSRVAAQTTAGYSVIATDVKHSGNASYHLAHTDAFQPQILTYHATFLADANASIAFRSRLGWASTAQTAKVQVSNDGGASWSDVDSQAGTNSAGQTSFQLRNVSLSAYAGQELKIRFAYLAPSGGYYQTSAGVGWYIDDVTFTRLRSVSEPTVASATSSGFSFTPPGEGEYVLSVRPVFPGRVGAFGPPYVVQASTGAPPAGFDAWAAGFEIQAGLPAGTIAGHPSGDANADGVPNLLAYALGLSPIENVAAQVPRPSASGGALTVDYQVDLSKDDVQLRPEVSVDLATWYSPGQAGVPAGFTDVVVSKAGDIETRRASIQSGHAGGSTFLRLTASRP